MGRPAAGCRLSLRCARAPPPPHAAELLRRSSSRAALQSPQSPDCVCGEHHSTLLGRRLDRIPQTVHSLYDCVHGSYCKVGSACPVAEDADGCRLGICWVTVHMVNSTLYGC